MVANPNAPFGLRPVKHLKGGVLRYNTDYSIASGYGTGLYEGDPVVVTGNGTNIQIATAAGANLITGVFAGCEFVDAAGDTKFMKSWPAGQVTKNAQDARAYVFDDPDILFEIMMNTMAKADVRALISLVAGNGNDLTGLSGWTGLAPAGGESQLKIYNLSGCVNPGGIPNAYGAYAVAQVTINRHELNNNVAANV